MLAVLMLLFALVLIAFALRGDVASFVAQRREKRAIDAAKIAALRDDMLSSLRPGDRVSIPDKRRRGSRSSVFLGFAVDGRLILRTQPLARAFRRPVDSLLTVL